MLFLYWKEALELQYTKFAWDDQIEVQSKVSVIILLMEDYQCCAVCEQGQIQGSRFQNFIQQYFTTIKDIKGGKIKLTRVLNSVGKSLKIY